MCRLSMKWLVLWSLWAARLVPQPTRPLRLRAGLVRGLVANDGTHLQYTAIPYATVNNRFQAATPKTKWDGVLDAFDEHIRCTQRFTSTRVLGREDCLTLNVYKPLPAADHLLPVMVFIHGGGFRDGSGSPVIYGPDYLIKYGVILVTFNYRLEVLGFLCLGTKDVPGNAGLKDQAQALRWVKENIKAFGGDPDNITIFGESAGSASVMYHLLSPMSRGLYNKAIMQSGSAMSPWSFQFEPEKIGRLLAKQVENKSYKTNEQIYDLFRSMPAEKLMSTRVPRKNGDIVISENIFVPCAEKTIPGVEAFLTDTPYNIITRGEYNKVPMIIGHNSAEGYMFAGKENDTMISKLDFYAALPRDLDIPEEAEKRRIADVFKRYYMGDKDITKKTLVDFAGYEGDSSITYPVVFAADLFAKTNDQPVFGYKFSYDGWMNLAKITFGFGQYPGATHADELFYMFKIKITLFFSFLETELIEKMTTMWTNFAKYGNPTPEINPVITKKWKPINKNNPKMLNIDKVFSTAPLWDDEIIRFWNTTYTKYRRKD